jgi:hypothetical protein
VVRWPNALHTARARREEVNGAKKVVLSMIAMIAVGGIAFAAGVSVGQEKKSRVYELCLRLQRGCGVRGWGRDGLGTGAQVRGSVGAEGVDVDDALNGRSDQ